MNETSWNAKCGIECLSSFRSVLTHDLTYWDSFSLQVGLMKHIFLIGNHSMQGWTTTARHGVTRKRATKRLKHTENLFRKNRCLLIRDLKPYPETRTTEPSLFAFKGGLIVYSMVLFCFSGCWFSGLELRISELFKCPKYWKRDVTLP